MIPGTLANGVPPRNRPVEGVVVRRPVHEVLICELGGQRYGLPASGIRELVRAVAIRRLLRDSASIEGVIDLRGTVVPVLDLRARLGLPSKAVDPSDHLIIIEAGVGGRPMAVRVDQALELVVLEPAALEPFPELMPGRDDAAGVVRLSDGLVPLLDLRALMATADSAPEPRALE
jgi:purine-binding chemotaxis protein CheW